MSKLANMVGGNGVAVAGVAAVAVVTVGVYLSGVFAPVVLPVTVSVPIPVVVPDVIQELETRPETFAALPEMQVEAQSGDTNVAAAAPEQNTAVALIPTQDEIADSVAAVIAPVTTATITNKTPTPEAAPIAIAPPEFDVVRVENDGTALIAGKGLAGAQVAILIDGTEIGTATVDKSGGFVSFLAIVPSDQARVLTLTMRGGVIEQDIASVQSVILAPAPVVVAQVAPDVAPVAAPVIAPVTDGEAFADQGQAIEASDAESATITALEPEQANTSETLAEPEPEIAAETVSVTVPVTASVTGSETETMAVVPAEPGVDVVLQANAEAKPAAPVILLADDSGVRVLQAPEAIGVAPEVMSSVALDAITYTPTGEVQIAGRGQSSRFVRIYLDNTPITTSRIAVDGNWRTDLPDVDTGIYTLRVDEIDNSGAVVSRIETPFKREEAALVVATIANAAPPTETVAVPSADPITSVKVITVQPGSTLWEIARESYGDGRQYVRVFQANRDRIRNADLIYPGQVFSVPSDAANQ